MVGAGQSSFEGRDSVLEFDRIACRRGGRLLFANVSFDLGLGEALLLSGPNGVGKSSLLRLAAGLLDPFAGKVNCQSTIALAGEELALDREKPLRDALQFWASLDGGNVAEALASLDMTHLAHVPVRMLSTGQRKRAVIARTIASGARLWLLDEPANGLDVAAVPLLEGVIARHRAAGGVVIVATHQPIALPGAASLLLAPPIEPLP
jgi:heme exporter protein A